MHFQTHVTRAYLESVCQTSDENAHRKSTYGASRELETDPSLPRSTSIHINSINGQSRTCTLQVGGVLFRDCRSFAASCSESALPQVLLATGTLPLPAVRYCQIVTDFATVFHCQTGILSVTKLRHPQLLTAFATVPHCRSVALPAMPKSENNEKSCQHMMKPLLPISASKG